MTKKTKVAHLVSHPIQYYVPLYRLLSASDSIELTVYYYCAKGIDGYYDEEFQRKIEWDIDLTKGYRSVFLTNKSDTPHTPSLKLASELIKNRYDVIWAHGYQFANVALAKIISMFTGSFLFVREDQTLLEHRSQFSKTVKKMLFAALFSGRSGAFYTGINSRAHLEHFGVVSEKLHPALHCVDESLFESLDSSNVDEKRASARMKFGIPQSAKVILFSGKLIEKKQPQLLVDAFILLSRLHTDSYLMIVGDGPLRPLIERKIEQNQLDKKLVMTGFLNQTELSHVYVAADVFVLPSRAHETWGLVVNEAMLCSLPIVASDHVGCVPDLVKHGKNGFVFPADDPTQLAHYLELLLADKPLRLKYGKASRELITSYSTASCAQSISKSCVAVSRLPDAHE